MASGAAQRAMRWHLFDAREKPVGRLGLQIVPLLIGKHKPTYVPRRDDGDAVVVVNAVDIKFSGRKYEKKLYRHHTGFPGGFREYSPRFIAEVKGRPEELLIRAVNGMLPKNKLRKQRMARFHVLRDANFEAFSHNFSEEELAKIEEMLAVQPEPYLDGRRRRKMERFPQEVSSKHYEVVDGKERLIFQNINGRAERFDHFQTGDKIP